ncbi:arrestin domain-containing protein 17-like [Mya arenaria]|uniref:arrestin domain-containing protein 17-like n=1 Tax=Mya arenaria TaxID=6604 RepID=UPI0022E2FF01|nr:arrestin domain-containing protein 17-like [Mya arenaria]XP_052816104.1 arrestin domain-containing protein 17-like [Mya arenaria]
MKLQTFQISFNNAQGVFNAGDSVSGVLHLHLLKPMKMRSIKLLFIGEAKTHWTVKQGKSKTNYRGREVYLNQVMYLYPPDISSRGTETVDHPAGNHAYPFHLAIPADFPSSFEGKKGHVRYFCRATIDRPWKFDSQTKRAFTVIHHLDLNLIPHAVVPIYGEENKKIEGCCCDAGEMTVSLNIGKTGYVPGEPLTYHMYIDNQSDYHVNSAYLHLIQSVTYSGTSDSILSSGRPKFHTKTYDFNLFSENVSVRQHTNQHINGSTLIPSLPPSNLDGCSIIEIKYSVKMKVYCDSSSCVIIRPITIGSIPVREHQPQASLIQSPSGYSSVEPAAPTAPFLTQEDISGVGPVLDVPKGPIMPPSYEEALAPPPSYSECVFGRTEIRDENDDRHTDGIMNWAPSYPYYDFTLRYGGQNPGVATLGRGQSVEDYDDDD